MLVFKFGGASVKNAEAVRNVGEIIKTYNDNLVLVISAMDKITNLLETLVRSYFNRDDKLIEILAEFKTFHKKITDELFGENKLPDPIGRIYKNLEKKINRPPSKDFNFEYDQIICFGELISTAIVSHYLNSANLTSQWVDIRTNIKTDDTYREALVDWPQTEILIRKNFSFADTTRYVTQGFIGSDKKGFSTSLGREGSDFTAAILGNILNAEYVAIWKDVPGVLNADPKQLEATQKLDELSYREAIEMSHSGAKIIHPKTIKPLHNKSIPLHVKSFLNPDSDGTIIHQVNHILEFKPVFIIKENQALITLSPNDFSFIGIKDIAYVFDLLSKNHFKVNLFQQSAIDLSLVVDHPESGFEKTIGELSRFYELKYNTGLELVTIRYYTDEAIKGITKSKKVYIEQKSRRTARLVTTQIKDSVSK